MAKKRRDTKLKSKRRKKKWFKVQIPEIYGKKEVGEITAYDPKELIGRTIELSMRDITGSRDPQKILLKIDRVRGEVAETEVVKSFLMDNTVQRRSRKIKERIEKVFSVQTGSGDTFRFKILLTTTKHIPRSTKSGLINALPILVENLLKKKSANDVFATDSRIKLSKEIKKGLGGIYPINNVYVWKVSLLSRAE